VGNQLIGLISVAGVFIILVDIDDEARGDVNALEVGGSPVSAGYFNEDGTGRRSCVIVVLDAGHIGDVRVDGLVEVGAGAGGAVQTAVTVCRICRYGTHQQDRGHQDG